MTDPKITTSHQERHALVYLRQSTPSQVKRHGESTRRQYALADRAQDLGWPSEKIEVIDDDLGLSGEFTQGRVGFARLTAEVALGHVGILFSIEVSRLARNSADWYRLLDLCGVTNTLIADVDGIYHPGHFNDRLLLGLKGTMYEAELHILRARLDGGIRNKALRGDLYRGQPIGYVRGVADADILIDPDEAIQGAVRCVFERFAEFGSARRVWRSFIDERRTFPTRSQPGRTLEWLPPTYVKIHHILTNPVYAGAYVYGKTRRERFVDENGSLRMRSRKLPREEWMVLIRDHHPGYIEWQTHEAILERLGRNNRPQRHGSGGAVREGRALLQGIATCGQCGRPLRTHYTGRTSSPGYHCSGKTLTTERRAYCLHIGAVQIDRAVCGALLEAIQPAGLEAALRAADQVESRFERSLQHWLLAVERARQDADAAERRYRAVEPENRLVVRNLEAAWERSLQALAAAQRELERRREDRPKPLVAAERKQIRALARDLERVWDAPQITPRDRKELLRTALEEVIVAAPRGEHRIDLTLRWRGGALTSIQLDRPRKQATIRTSEDTVNLLRRLAQFHPDDVIAGILNRQGKVTAYGHPFNKIRVKSLRQHWNIPRFDPATRPANGELVTIKRAAELLGIATSTVHRWLNDGYLDGEQTTPGAPWRIRLTENSKLQLMEKAPPGYVPMREAVKRMGVTRQTVLQRVKNGSLHAIHIRAGRKKALRIKLLDDLPNLFEALK